jgi:predicted amidohydrolase
MNHRSHLTKLTVATASDGGMASAFPRQTTAILLRTGQAMWLLMNVILAKEEKGTGNRFGVQFSQLHALALADMDGDGLLDLVTGKTYLAHDGGDPGLDQPAVLYWFKLTRAGGQAEFVPHLIDDDSGIGRRIITTDLNKDGLIDIVIGNKKGLFVFTQAGNKPTTDRPAGQRAAQEPPLNLGASRSDFLSMQIVADATSNSTARPADAAAEEGTLRLRVAGAQFSVVGDVRKNVEAITRAIQFAAREKADVLVTPEGSLSGYTHQFDAPATARALEEIVHRAREAKVALVLGTCFADADGARYDAQRFYDRRGEYLGFHSKILLCRRVADPTGKGEFDFFKSSPLRTFSLDGLTVGGLVCNDMWANPEWTPMADPHLARQLAGLGARVVFLSVNSGQAEGEELALNRGFHEANLRIRARSAKLWVVVADASDPQGQRASNCPSGVLGPDGRWVVQVEPKGEQFFAHTIEAQPLH